MGLPVRFQQQPNHWSCLPTAFANFLDVGVQEIFDFCGHDGSEYVFDAPYPVCGESLSDVLYLDALRRRSFHIQEIIDFCISKDWTVTEILRDVISTNGSQHFSLLSGQRIYSYINKYDGIIIGEVNNRCHAVTWRDKLIYDPNGITYPLDKFNKVEVFYLPYQNLVKNNSIGGG
jgi:hypothetical protein